MFGTIICNKSALTAEELARYRSVYCGLCQSLKKRYGNLERISLNYDMTFVALFLSALYEPEKHPRSLHCAAHPLKKQLTVSNPYIDYAADMTIAYSYYKCLDDWNDEHNPLSRKYASILRKHYDQVKAKYPRQCNRIEESIQELSRIEASRVQNVDASINCNGRMVTELLICKEDYWSGTLRQIGYELGRFIYLIDAAVDYESDLKKGRYNPLIIGRKKPDEIRGFLENLMGNVVQCYEQLPILQDDNLLRNILYGGVWTKYNVSLAKQRKEHHGIRSI